MSRADKVLGVFLVWKSACENMRVYVDLTFTLLNPQHFSLNESFSGKQVKFTAECPAQGSRNFVPVSDLFGRHFTDTNGEFQLALCLGNIRTMVDTALTVSTSLFSNLPLGALASLGGRSHYGVNADGSGKEEKLETSYFTFGGFDWNVTLYPGGIRQMHGSNEERISVYLQRCTGFDHQCRVRYSMVLGDGDRRFDSGIVDDVSDSDGKSYGWHPRLKFQDLVHKGMIRVHLEMHLANTLSEVISSILLSQADQGANSSGVLATPNISQCYDRDKQAWSVKSDCHSETVRLHMVYKDIQNVPRNHLRFVSWTAYLLRYHGKANHVEPIPLPGAPFSHYYAQDASDEGIIMETDVLVSELKEPGCPYLTDKGQLRVQIEWEESYLLFQATYHKYDDVSRLHNTQMRREIQALQAENYSLERQLFSYQKSLAYAHSRGTISDDLTPPDGRGEDEEPYFHHENPAYSIGDRSISTDTDYA